MKNENDLRVIKTRTNILSAFITLMKEKPLIEISVKEICARALCSRNTFYAHFPNKEAILEHLIEDCVDGIVGGAGALVEDIADIDQETIARYNRNIVHAVAGSREKIAFLLQYADRYGFVARLNEAVFDGFLESTMGVAPDASKDIRFSAYCRYLSGGTVNFIIHWMQHPEVGEEEAFSMLCDIHSAPSRVAIDYLTGRAQSPSER